MTLLTTGNKTVPVKQWLRVMKFGGTSVGDAACIQKVVEIIRSAAHDARLAVVVSAMAGVTNRLIEAANRAKAGDGSGVAEIFSQLSRQHEAVVTTLIHAGEARRRLQRKLNDLLGDGERLCQNTILSGQLTPRALDEISGLGERLSAPLVAAALEETGIASAAIEATELLVTDTCHGGAEPWIEPTRARSAARLLPLLQEGKVPVITGFIGANPEGIPTTLGRGGSDYSASIFGAVLEADEVLIWSDVAGLLTADPKLVAEAVTIPEISYHEAAELAHFGAKVLHPKTLRPLVERGIPVWIKSTFQPAEAGTKITPAGITPGGAGNGGSVKALAAMPEAALIRIAPRSERAGPAVVPDSLARAMAAARADLLVFSESCRDHDLCLVIPSALAGRAADALRQDFSSPTGPNSTKPAKATPPSDDRRGEPALPARIEGDATFSDFVAARWSVSDSPVSVITLVGQNLRNAPGTVARLFAALGKEKVSVIATGHGSSACSMSFVVPPAQMTLALAAIHSELELNLLPEIERGMASGDRASDRTSNRTSSGRTPDRKPERKPDEASERTSDQTSDGLPALWKIESERASAD